MMRCRSARLCAALALAAVAFLVAPAAASGQGTAAGEPTAGGTELSVSRNDLTLSPYAEPLAGAVRFRFLPDGAWVRCERDLELSAARGEERTYRIELEDAAGLRSLFEYRIDKRKPEPPKAGPAGGLFNSAVAPVLSSEHGTAVYWALFSPDDPNPGFAVYGDDSRPRLAFPRASGTATYTLIAYAEDEAGNRSSAARFIYRLTPQGLHAAAPPAGEFESAVMPDSHVVPPRLERRSGSVDLFFFLSEGTSLLTAVGYDEMPSTLSAFTLTESVKGVARLTLGCPYGWSGKLRVHYGTYYAGSALCAPEPLIVDLDYPIEESPPVPAPEAPVVEFDAAGRGSFILFPAYDGDLFVSVADAPPEPYAEPIYLAPGPVSTIISWYGEDRTGLRSATGTLRLSLPPAVPEIELEGVEDGAVAGNAVKLVPSASAALRYEMRSGSIGAPEETPNEPSGKSALVGEGLSFNCPQGEERWFALRYRAFAGLSADSPAGESVLLRFSIDRKPPERPRPTSAPPAYADRGIAIDFAGGERGTQLFVSVAVDGASAPFERNDGLVELPGSDLGPISYLVRAYRSDAAGNRSLEMPLIALVVDLSSVYAADDASEAGDGSPARPYRSFDDAVAAALAKGKRSVNLRGVFTMKRRMDVSADIRLVGGFGPGWARDGAARARLAVALPERAAAFTVRAAKLSLKDIDLSLASAGPAALIDIAGGSLAIADSSLAFEGSGDLLLVGVSNGSVEIDRSVMEAERAMSCALFRAENSEVTLRDSVIVARAAVRTFTAIDLEGGSLILERSLVESSADLALCMLSLRDSKIVVDRSLFKADSGSGYLRMGDFTRVEGELRNSRMLVDWSGDGILFETSGRCPAFRHLTIAAETKRGRLDCFSSSGEAPELWNSILSFAAGGGTLLRTDVRLRAGQVVSNCLWGFERLVDGPSPASSLDALDAINSREPNYAARHQISEPPNLTFAAPVKSLSPLSRGSACVDGATPLGGEAYFFDFKGLPRPSSLGKRLPDIGADEAAE